MIRARPDRKIAARFFYLALAHVHRFSDWIVVSDDLNTPAGQ
jgi:hypothetical protein